MPDPLDSNTARKLVEWKPFDKQKEFIRIPFEIFEALYGGAAGGGKSDVCLLLPLIYEFHLHPKFKGLVLRRTLPDLEQEIIPRSRQWYAPAGAIYNEQKKRWTFPEGGIYSFGHAENKDDIRKYDSAEINIVEFEEATHFLEFQYRYLVGSRMRSSAPGELPSIVRSSSTPGNIGHNFFRKRFVDPYPDGGKVLLDKASGLKRIFIKALPTDNPYLDPEYIRKLHVLPEAERRAKMGDWYIYEGQVFDTFRPDGPYGDEPLNANHVVAPFDVPDFWPKIASIDWGFKAKTWFGVLAISPEGRFYVIHERTFERENISSWATQVGKDLEVYANLKEVRLDSNAWNDVGHDENIAEQFERFSGYRPVPADKGKGSRVSGKLLLQECLRFIPKPVRKVVANTFNPELADRILRVHGVQKYKEYIDLFTPELEETNIPILQIFNTCKALIECIPLCVYNTKESAIEDVKEFDGDDPYDGLRYLLRAAKSYIAESQGEFDAAKKIEIITSKLRNSGDMTSFYRQMEFLESKKGQETFGVQRYRKRTT